jgi:hypothetical protein
MTPEISLLEAELEQAQDLIKSRRHRLQAAKDAYWTDHFKARGVVEGETVVIAKDHYDREFVCVIWWTNRPYPCMIRRRKDGSAHRNPGHAERFKEIIRCFSNS